MTQKEDTIGALRKIIENRKYTDSSEQWVELVKQIPDLISSIITSEYETELDKQINMNPLNPTSLKSVREYHGKIVDELRSTFAEWPPFTMVRLAEVLVEPKRYYSNTEKFLRALQNICSVSSNVNDFHKGNDSESQNEKSKEKERNEDGEVVGIVTNEGQVMLLSKIDWLTEEDKTEIESDGYLDGGMVVANGVFEHYEDEKGLLEEEEEDPDYIEGDVKENEEGDEDEDDYEEDAEEEGEGEEDEEEEAEAENEGQDNDDEDLEEEELVRKRKVEKEHHDTGGNSIVGESPEKKIKTDEANEGDQTNNDSIPDESNTTLEEDKMQVD